MDSWGQHALLGSGSVEQLDLALRFDLDGLQLQNTWAPPAAPGQRLMDAPCISAIQPRQPLPPLELERTAQQL